MIKIVKMKQAMKMVKMKVMEIEIEMFKLMDMFRISSLLTNL